MSLQLRELLDDEKCFAKVRELRWPDEVNCIECDGKDIVRNGHHRNQSFRRQYICKGCGKHFDDLTASIFEGSHLELRQWILGSYLMGLNLSNSQIAEELDISPQSAQMLCTSLREGIVKKNS